MSKFHLLPCVPDPRMHGPNGYREIIESVQWGLEQLGHEVTYSLNAYYPASTNIVFGAQMLPLEVLKQLRGDTIVYNFEQGGAAGGFLHSRELFHLGLHDRQRGHVEIARHESTKLVPVGYAPVLSQIPKAQDQDIEIFFYGTPGQKRLNAFHQLFARRLSGAVCQQSLRQRERLANCKVEDLLECKLRGSLSNIRGSACVLSARQPESRGCRTRSGHGNRVRPDPMHQVDQRGRPRCGLRTTSIE